MEQPGTLTIHDICLTNIKDNNIRVIGNTGCIHLKDSALCLSRNFSYTTGGLRFEKDVIITGTNTFNYETASSSTIQSKSTLFLDKNLCFNYAPIVANRDLIEMSNQTASLFMYGCTLKSSTTGLRLTNGTLCVDHKNLLFNDEATSVSQAFCLGNGVANND